MQKLKNNFENMGEFKAPSKIILSKKESEKLDLEYNFYINKV